MKISKERLKEIILEEAHQIRATRTNTSQLSEAPEIDMAAIQDDAEKVAEKLMEPDGELDGIILAAAEKLVSGVDPEHKSNAIQTAVLLIKQAMAKAGT